MTDVMKQLKDAGFEPEMVEDSGGFKPFSGRYVSRIDDAGRKQGVSTRTGESYDMRTMNLQVTEVVEGDNALNRYLSRTYNTDDVGTKKLLNDLFTAGIPFNGSTDAELDEYLGTLKDKTVFVSAWESKEFTTKDGRTIAGGKQASRIVKEFRKKKVKPETVASKVPF